MDTKSERILSLDVFRGLTMALMVLVNSQGTRSIYPLLEHAAWNGCTLADLVFPAFLFIVGVTTVISLKRQKVSSGHVSVEIYENIGKRSILLLLFGLFINAFPFHFDVETVRFYGILQRIAVCYFICALVYLHTSIWTQLFVFLGILVGYWIFLALVPIPGHVGDQLIIDNNWVEYIDHWLFSPVHLYRNFDPEGLISTIPAIATTLSGLITGSFLLSSLSKNQKFLWMLLMGGIFLLVGWYWGYIFPINKNLWTSSFVLWTSGVSLVVFAFCFYVIDVQGYSKWAWPFKVFGMNALFIFIFHVLLLKLQAVFTWTLRNGVSENLRVAISDYLFSGFNQEMAGLLYSLVFLLINFGVAVFLYRRKIFFKL